jgi:anti-sigma regulatory factor (Ser/Thr protein kinase)
MTIQIVMTLPPTFSSVSLARHTLAHALRLAAVEPECIDESQVALAEACTNVFDHVAAGRNFEVVINISDLELTMHILDSGPGIPQGHGLAELPDVAAERGRGLALMTAFADEARFESDDGGGSVRLRKDLRQVAETTLDQPG